MDYKIVCASGPDALAAGVNDWLGEGYEPCGSAFATADQVCQPVIRRGPDAPPEPDDVRGKRDVLISALHDAVEAYGVVFDNRADPLHNAVDELVREAERNHDLNNDPEPVPRRSFCVVVLAADADAATKQQAEQADLIVRLLGDHRYEVVKNRGGLPLAAGQGGPVRGLGAFLLRLALCEGDLTWLDES